MAYRRILVGTDLSDAAGVAARVASKMRGDAARVRVVHVAPTTDMPERVGHSPGARQETLRAWCERAGLGASDQVVLFGSPGREIAREAAGSEADLVVVGHVGRGRIERVLLGSTARSVLRLSHCDTLVVRGPDPPPAGAPFRSILVATDMYAPSARAARRALELARSFDASLAVTHAIDPDMWTQAVARTPRDEFPDADGWLRGTYGDMLVAFNDEHLEGKAKLALTHGSPGKAVAEEARLQHADLVVVGTHGAGAIERLLLGAHAEAIVERAPCSVLVVR